MGDTCCDPNKGTGKFVEYLKQRLPGVYIKSISTAESEGDDQKSSFMGSVNGNIATVCEQLQGDKELQGGFNAIGFSQGGLFLRGVVERCTTQVRQLVTFGSPHAGTADIPNCKDGGFWCGVARRIARSSAYGDYAQHNIIQAQYYKDIHQLDVYMAKNVFLPDINNEHAHKLSEYAERLVSLERLVLVQFANDTMIVPKETAWFGFYQGEKVVPLRQQAMYREDWLGLKLLDTAGRIDFLTAPGEHMQFTLDYFERHILGYLNATHPHPLVQQVMSNAV
jgi:palmitoyl-protein thioesterase